MQKAEIQPSASFRAPPQRSAVCPLRGDASRLSSWAAGWGADHPKCSSENFFLRHVRKCVCVCTMDFGDACAHRWTAQDNAAIERAGTAGHSWQTLGAKCRVLQHTYRITVVAPSEHAAPLSNHPPAQYTFLLYWFKCQCRISGTAYYKAILNRQFNDTQINHNIPIHLNLRRNAIPQFHFTTYSNHVTPSF